MNTLIRLAATSVILAFASTAFAETTWRMATKMPVNSPEGKVFQKFADLTGEYTDGELTIEVFPNEQLGKEDAALEQLQAGIVNIYAEGFGYMRKWAPELSWVSPAFVFDDYDHWVRFMDSDLVKGWFDKAAAESGVIPLGSPLADDSGVLFLPPEDLDEIIETAEEKTEKGRIGEEKISSGTHLGEMSGASNLVRARLRG